MLKNATALAVTCIAVAGLVAASNAWSNDRIARQILKLVPEADTNGDGVLSEAEEATLSRRALKKHPRADIDGDGVLSDAEKEDLLRKVAGTGSRAASDDHSNTALPSPEETRRAIVESPVRQGPQPIKAAEKGVGRQIPNLSFTDINGKPHMLSSFSDRKAVVLAMTGTGCPLCLKYSPSLAAIEKRYRGRDVAFVFVNPNASEDGDRLQEAVSQHEFQGPYVSDGAMRLPATLGAETTTEVFVLDRARTLVYRGAVDDQYGFGYALDESRRHYLPDALDAVLEGDTPAIQATTSPGCELFYDDSDPPATAAVITYHNRISRIIQANCIECHRNDGIAPITFETYGEVKEYANMIRNVVDRGIMPPWFAAPQSVQNDNEPSSLHWANDRSLSADEKTDLFAWIKAGAPEGDAGDAPLSRGFPDGWLIG